MDVAVDIFDNYRVIAMVYNILIIFDDGTRKVITSVSDYGISELGCFYFKKNNYKSFLPKEHIVFFGREFDWGFEDYD